MNHPTQVQKAETFSALHRDPRLLVLPNVWDVLGARMLQSLGYPAVATASAAVAYAHGHDDGERMPFELMLDTIARIAAAVDVPLSADLERGYGATPEAVEGRIAQLLQAGAVGVNLEDGLPDHTLRPATEQAERLRAARAAANAAGVPLVINARVDVYVARRDASPEARLDETLARARAYLAAGADCVYPMGAGDPDALRALRAALDAPINVLAWAGVPTIAELEAIGINRLSLGPGLLKASATAMKGVAEALQRGGPYDAFTGDAVPSEEIRTWLARSP